ncbi:MAG: hypothetical protein ACN6QT_18050 [Burkholderia contaminans]|uniref:Uncharacterized protein n=1 Tax=Burkholderia contaminans TaxID=488447 RepID=A0AAP4R2T1_9BURK|nr:MULTISPECIES: hypothetical protein [Burkholderia]MBD1410741.1 hypothetical protein [Burkholderia contaminans]MBH9669443.1 hypothetical protein [Burkholderia contaminans]MBH9676427.1 hypothetical protein [Burkholderia contaminans]MBH9706851.1 hypothetical protein [Burkholderia contaminans]MBM6425975.1 hypothetical protein [Burkholderia contaminans]
MMPPRSSIPEFSVRRTVSMFVTWGIVVAALSVCIPFGSVHGQPADATTPDPAGNSPTESRTPANLSATQALQRMLALIQASGQVTDITPETVHRIFGVQTTAIGKDQFGYGQRLPGNWAFSLQRVTVGDTGPRVDLIFDPIPGTQASPLTACEPTFAQFTHALESMGFSRHTHYGEHGRWVFDSFERPRMDIRVYPLSALSDNGEPLGPACVKAVLVR